MSFTRSIKNLIKPLSAEQRQKVVNDLGSAAAPGFDFFILVVLSCSIATLGLITNSAAVIIGAMLLAPLMSPIIGIGLFSIVGDRKKLGNSLTALVRGILLAVFLAVLVTIVNRYLPFVSVQELSGEILARSRPTPIDLAIAFAGGLAAAYALTQPNLSAALPGVAIATALMPPLCTIGIGIALERWDVAGGAGLLFLTNTITIAFAAILVFFLRGFGSSTPQGEARIPHSLLFSALLTALLLIPLSYYSVRFFNEAAENRFIRGIVEQEVNRLDNVSLLQMDISRNGIALDMVLSVQSNTPLRYEQVTGLQKAIVAGINQPISLKVNQIIAQRLDPLIPPTATPTATPTLTFTPTYTFTPGPSPTFTHTPTQTPTLTASVTPTATFTQTLSPTPTATFTPTPAIGRVLSPLLMPGMFIYQSPGGPAIGILYTGQRLTIFEQRQVFNGIVWALVADAEGRKGWMPELYLALITATPTATTSPTVTTLPTITAISSVTASPTVTASATGVPALIATPTTASP